MHGLILPAIMRLLVVSKLITKLSPVTDSGHCTCPNFPTACDFRDNERWIRAISVAWVINTGVFFLGISSSSSSSSSNLYCCCSSCGLLGAPAPTCRETGARQGRANCDATPGSSALWSVGTERAAVNRDDRHRPARPPLDRRALPQCSRPGPATAVDVWKTAARPAAWLADQT